MKIIKIYPSTTSDNMADLNQDELKLVATAFKEMKVKPNLESTTDFKDWMVQYVTSLSADVKGDPGDTDQSAATNATDKKIVTTSNYVPKIATFSGDKSKQDTSFELWKYEVECLVRDKYSESIIQQSIRRSLKGEAGEAAMRIGPNASVQVILKRMEDIFGSVERGENIMEEFYSSSQKKGEDSMKWSCRLEEIYRKAVAKGVAKQEDANEKLKSRYWNGLQLWLKDITGYKYEQVQTFDDLRREIRLIEKDHEKKTTTTSMSLTAENDSSKSEMQELKGMIQQLTTKVTNLEKGNQRKDNPENKEPQMHQSLGAQQFSYHYQRGRGSYRGRAYSRPLNRQNYSGNYGQSGNQDQFYSGPQDRYNDHYNENSEPTCYRCGQKGHLALGCRVIIDHRRGLNSRRPSSRGRW